MEPHDRRRGGRPTKSEGPRVPYEDVDRILVFGEVVACEDGNGTTVVYPSYRELADRYGVSNSVIAEYAKSRNVQRRRKDAHAKIQAKVEQKVIEMRATAVALSKDDELRIIDSYLAGFETALADKRVRFDNPADFNTMVRLKEFVMGNADSRQEIHAALSLESLQARHRQVTRVAEASPAERGEVDRASLPSAGADEVSDPPQRAIDDATGEPPARDGGRLDPETAAPVVAGGGNVGAGRPDAGASRADGGTPAFLGSVANVEPSRRDTMAAPPPSASVDTDEDAMPDTLRPEDLAGTDAECE